MVATDRKSQIVLQRLRSLVASLDVGSRLPGERALSSELGVSRMTARKAIEALASEGWLDVRHGSGTYVAQRPHAKAAGLSSFSAEMRRRGLVPASRVLEFEWEAADPSTAVRLEIEPGDQVLRFTRLRLADSEPVGVETTWIAASLVAGMEPDDLSDSLFDVLADKFDITLGQASSTVDPALAEPAVAESLGIAPTEPCLRVRMDYQDNRNRPVMAATCLYRGDRYQLNVVLTATAFASSGER